MLKYRMPQSRLLFAQLLILFPLAVTSWLAVEYSLYWRIWWLDIPMHLLGGLWAGIFSVWLIARRDNHPSLLWCLTFALFVGVAWEVFEYSEGIAAAYHFSYPFDTAKDLAMDLLGAIFGWILGQRLANGLVNGRKTK